MGYTFKADDVYGLASKLGSDVREKATSCFSGTAHIAAEGMGVTGIPFR